MTEAIAIGVAILAAIQGLTIYLRRATNSLNNAQKIWGDIVSATERLIDDPHMPQAAAEMAFALSQVAGCGCFVRGLIIRHYAPFLMRRAAPDSLFKRTLGQLSPPQRAEMDKLIIMVIVFDSFSNPLQGWVFRRILRSYKAPQSHRPSDIREARDVTATVVKTIPAHQPSYI